MHTNFCAHTTFFLSFVLNFANADVRLLVMFSQCVINNINSKAVILITILLTFVLSSNINIRTDLYC